MALGTNENIIIFERADSSGLWLGTKENYQKRGTYTGELVKICDSEELYTLHNLADIIREADNKSPEVQKKLQLIFYILQTTDAEKLQKIWGAF